MVILSCLWRDKKELRKFDLRTWFTKNLSVNELYSTDSLMSCPGQIYIF